MDPNERYILIEQVIELLKVVLPYSYIDISDKQKLFDLISSQFVLALGVGDVISYEVGGLEEKPFYGFR